MNKKSLFLLVFCLAISSKIAFSAIDDDRLQLDENKINQTDRNGLKQGYWIYFGKDRPEAGIPANGKIEEGLYEDSRREGVWVKYHNDGLTPRIKGTYINNRPQGSYTKMHPNGKIKEVGTFEKNTYRDSLKRFHENGVLEYEAIFNENGQENGTIKYFYPNGQLEFEYKSINGKPSGKATRFYENGDIKELIEYNPDGRVVNSIEKDMVKSTVAVKDPGASKEKAPHMQRPKTKGVKFQLNGYNKCYNNNDEIWQDGEFRNGELWDGKIYEYDTDGILLKVRVFKKGVYHSDGQL